MYKIRILMCENYIDEIRVGWYNVKYLKLFAKESKFMKKTRILALVLAILAMTALLCLVACKDDSGKSGNCADTGEHKWGKWSSKGDATCTEDGTRARKCPVCKTEEVEVDPGTATGHYFLTDDYKLNEDATCTEDGTETAICYLCSTEKDTRVAVDSALGHRYGNNPVAEESHNGYNVFVCLRADCGHKETFDNGTIDEDFEYVNVLEDNSKRYFTPGAGASVVSYAEGEGKYLLLQRTAEKVIGDSAFGIYLTPDYDLYKTKDYVVSYDIIITENTRDLVLLAGKKAYTEQVFATYDAETASIIVNGKSVYTFTAEQFGTVTNLAFVLDDGNFELDMYVNKSLYVSKNVYDKKDSYYLASELEYLCIRMVAEPKTASEFGIDNIKTYVGKTVTDPAAPSVSENVTSTIAVPHNIMGAIDMAWIDEFRSNLKTIGNQYSDDKFNQSFAYEALEKNGQMVDVMTWQNYNTGIPYFNIYDFKGLETYTLSEANAGGTNYDFSGGKTYQVYDLSGYDSITINFYCDMTSEELAAMGREGYQMLIAFYTPNAWRTDKNNYWSTYTNTYYTFTAEDVLNGEDGWQSVTIPLSKFNQTQIQRVTHFSITGKGWGSNGIGIGTATNNDNNAVDGTVIKIQSITLDKPGTVTHAKLSDTCEHSFGATKDIAATCTTPGFSVSVCDNCKGEQVLMDSFVAATGHNYVNIQDVAASCTEKGYFSEKCTNCNDKIRYDREATGHVESTVEGYEPTVIAPTCYSTGITIRTCGVCNDTFETNVTDMIEHTWDEGVITAPNCTEEGVTTYTCIHNGENGCDGVKTEAIAALGHEADPAQNGEYVAATCEKDAYTPTKCVRCGYGMEIVDKDNKKLGHDWQYDATSDKNVPATCYADGTDFYACTRCSKTKTETVTATGMHNIDYTADMVIITAPTCTVKGVGGYACTNDGCTYVETQEIDVIAHTEDTTVAPVVTAPVCGVDGYTTRKCSVCGGTYKTDIVEAEEHDDGGVAHDVQIAGCDQDGWERFTCIKCQELVTVEGTFVASKGGHKYELVIDDELKALVKHCTVCDEKISATTDKMPTYAELLEAVKGTLYADMVITDAVGTETTGSKDYGTVGAYIQFCSKGGAALKITVGDNGGVDGITKYVKWEHTGKDTQHTYVNAFTKDSIPTGGKLVFEVAIRLGEPNTDGKYVASDFQIIDRSTTATAAGGNAFVGFATFTADGKITFKGSSYVVTLSKEKFTKIALAIDVDNNKMNIYVDGVLVNNTATFLDEKTAAGFDMTKLQFEEIRMFQYSSADSNSWIDIADIALYGAAEPYAITGVDYCAIKGTEHEEDLEAIQVIAPTCTERGYTIHTCANCGGTWIDTYVEATGHIEYEIGEEYVPTVIAPSCFEKGYTKRQCATCNEFYNTDETEMVAHTMGTEPTDYVAPTCTEPGYDVFTCTVEGCGHTEKAEYEATGHSADSTEVSVKAPTCTADGYTIMNCPDCGKNYKANIVPANGHQFGDFIIDFDSTCTETGKQTKYCENCIWTESATIAAKGHTWEQTGEVAATCYADGSKSFVCTVCAETKTDAITARPAHNWSDYVVEIAPTCTETGKEVRTCMVEECGATSDRTIAKKGHQLDEGEVTTAPTCTVDGIRTKSCTRENCEYTETVAEPAIGHDMVLDPENNTYSCTENGVEAKKCTRCDYTEAVEKEATGHNFTGEYYTFSEATCYADGIRTRKCANCDALQHEEGSDVEKQMCVVKTTIAHNMVAGEVIAPTTEAEGYTIYNCTNEGCTHTENRDFVPAITTGTQGFEFTEVPGGYYITAYTGTDTEITIPATYMGKPVIGIDPAVFAYDVAGITGVTIESDALFEGGDYGIFAGCNLDYVVLGADVTYVPAGTFEVAVIGTLYIEGDAYVEDIDLFMVEIGETVNGPKED